MELQPTNTEEIQIQYELAMAIGTSLDLTSMVRVAMDAFVRELTCVAAVVYDCRDGRLVLVVSGGMADRAQAGHAATCRGAPKRARATAIGRFEAA